MIFDLGKFIKKKKYFQKFEDEDEDGDGDGDRDKKTNLSQLLSLTLPNETALQYSMLGRKRKKKFVATNMYLIFESKGAISRQTCLCLIKSGEHVRQTCWTNIFIEHFPQHVGEALHKSHDFLSMLCENVGPKCCRQLHQTQTFHPTYLKKRHCLCGISHT